MHIEKKVIQENKENIKKNDKKIEYLLHISKFKLLIMYIVIFLRFINYKDNKYF